MAFIIKDLEWEQNSPKDENSLWCYLPRLEICYCIEPTDDNRFELTNQTFPNGSKKTIAVYLRVDTAKMHAQRDLTERLGDVLEEAGMTHELVAIGEAASELSAAFVAGYSRGKTAGIREFEKGYQKNLIHRVGDAIGGLDPSERVMLMKNGYYYRPGWCGYTSSKLEAGFYNREEAQKHADATGDVIVVEICEDG